MWDIPIRGNHMGDLGVVVMSLVSRTFKHGNAFYRVSSDGTWEALAVGFFIDDPYATRPKQKWISIPAEKVPLMVRDEAS